MVQCPGHDDGRASLSVRPGDEQPVIFHCHAGCEPHDVVKAGGLEWSEVCRPLEDGERRFTNRDGQTVVAYYVYTDEAGAPLYRQTRFTGKHFEMQRHSNGRYLSGMGDTRRVLYGLPRVVEAIAAGRTIWLVEGEKDAQRAMQDGLDATCAPNGAKAPWLEGYTRTLAGADVVIVEDADEPGRAFAERVKAALVQAGCTVRIMESAIPGCKDYTDHVEHGGTYDSLTTLWNSRSHRPITQAWTVEELIDAPRERRREIIPGMLAENNVVLLVGPEGHGKSTLIRQIAMQAACGLKPFTLASMDPLSVLVVDAENDEVDDEWRDMLGLAAYHGRRPEGRLHVVQSKGTEVNLLSEVGQSFLMGWVEQYRPAICCLGPIYKLLFKDVKDDDAVRELERCLSRASGICHTAWIIEHHAPHKGAVDTKRVMRPIGSSVFMRWPDFGFGMTPTDDQSVYRLEQFRGSRKRARVWPERIRWGAPNTAEFPWEDAGPEDGGKIIPMGRRQ